MKQTLERVGVFLFGLIFGIVLMFVFDGYGRYQIAASSQGYYILDTKTGEVTLNTDRGAQYLRSGNQEERK